MNARLPAIGLLSVLVLLPPSVRGQDDLLHPPPGEHLGWGTLEDVFVDLGAGAAVSTLSGNLVLHVEPVSRPWLPVGARMALTYNHQDPEGAMELGPGWSFDLGRYTAAGAWGDRLLLEGDGFRDTFWAGPPPTGAELDQIADDVVEAWRRDTPAAQRRALGGVGALRELLASDAETLGAMRLRYLGAPSGEEDTELVFGSGARGVRTLVDTDEGRLLTFPDGAQELFGQGGELSAMRPVGGAPWTMGYKDGRLVSAVSRGIEEWALVRDSRGRIQTLRSSDGAVADFDYLGPLLRSIDSEHGVWRFDHDERGRVRQMTCADGVVAVRYGVDGRVEAASGPRGSIELRSTGDTDAVTVTVTGLPGGVASVRWESGRRRRTVSRRGRLVEAVTFSQHAALPTSIVTGEGEVAVRWDDGGRLLGVTGGGHEVVWERSAAGTIEGIRVDGERGAVTTEGGRLLSWSDPATRRTVMERDHEGRLRALQLPAGPEVTVGWGQAGGLSQVAVRDGVRVGVPLEGVGVGALEWGGAVAGVRRDASGRLSGVEGPTGRVFGLPSGPGGRIEGLQGPLASVRLVYDGRGLLSGWSGPEGAVTLRRDLVGRPQALTAGDDERWRISWDDAGRPVRLDRDGAALAVEFTEDGPVSWERPGGGRTTLERDRDGRVSRIADTALGLVELERDSGGHATVVRRGSGGWRIQRDRTGRPQGLTDPLGAHTDFTLDGAGRPSSVRGPEGQGWRLRRDAFGRLVTVRSPEGDWVVRRGPDGLPKALSTPMGRTALLRHDRSGRPIQLELPDQSTRATWGLAGPTQLGSIRWRFGPSGALVGWGGEGEPELRWLLDQDEQGRAASVRSAGSELLEITRDHAGRPTRVGRWGLDWRNSGLQGITYGGADGEPIEWRIGRDAAGRARSLVDPWARSVTVERDLAGDLRAVTLVGEGGEGSAAAARDQGVRVSRLELGGVFGPGALAIARDGLGRVTGLARERRGAVAVSAAVLWADVPPPEEGLLAKAFDVQTDDGEAPLRSPAGSRSLTITGGLGRELLRFATVLDDDSHPQVGALPGRAVTAQYALAWGPTPVIWDGAPVLPSPVGSGPMVTARGLRIGGAMPMWASADGARAAGEADPTPLAMPNHALRPGGPPPALAGDAARMERLWTGASVRPADLAWMPEGVPESIRAWAHAGDRFAEEALVSADVGRGDAGALLPALPGARTLIPGPPNARRMGMAELLVIAGDLSEDVLLVSELAGVGPTGWQVELPAAAALAAVRRRLESPTAPPGDRDERIAGIAPHGYGILTERGARLEALRRWDVRPALSGIPAGTQALLPGTGAPGEGEGEALGSTERAGRGSALDALADDPLGVGEVALGQARAGSTLLALRALAREGGTGLGGYLPDPAAAESWVVELPSGARLVVDGRGRLLSIDTGGRLQRAFTQATIALAARALLADAVPSSGRGSLADASDDSPWVPPFLPERGGVVESRWGLAPGTPELPLDALGRSTAPGWPRVGP